MPMRINEFDMDAFLYFVAANMEDRENIIYLLKSLIN